MAGNLTARTLVAVGLFALCVVTVPPAHAALSSAGGPLPLAFEPNQGQADASVRYLARGRGAGLFLTQTEAVFVLIPPDRAAPAGQRSRPGAERKNTSPSIVRMRMVGAEATTSLAGVERRIGRSHYLSGGPAQWRRDVPTFARVRYDNVYPGISLLFYGSDRQLEYDFIVAPGADPAAVVLAFEGAEQVRLDAQGDVVVRTDAGELRVRRPVIYQEVRGERRPIAGGYVLDGDRVRFRIAPWDTSRPLVIDPVVNYSTLLGGRSNDQGFGIAVDSGGNAYVTGSTISLNFPVSSAPFQVSRRGVTDAFVTKLDPTGTTVLHSTFLGGSGDDAGNAIAVDALGNAYVAGTTNSLNFPVLGPVQPRLGGGNDAFVAKLDPTGSALVYSTYLGSNTEDVGNGIALDAVGNAYVAGSTEGSTFPNNGAITCLSTKAFGVDAFVVRVDASGATLGYCRFIGGVGVDIGNGIATDAAGNVWFVGSTTSVNLPVHAALQPVRGGRADGFVGKLDTLGGVIYLTYLGGADTDEVFAVAVDAVGNAHVAGATRSVDFPTISPLQPALGGRSDAFVAKLNAAGSALVFSTYLGGLDDDVANGIGISQIDSAVYVAGATESVDFPVAAPIQATRGGRIDAFLTKLNAAGSQLVYSTYLGDLADDFALALAVDRDGTAYLTGATNSAAFPTLNPIQRLGGLLDVFVVQVADGAIIQFSASSYQVAENGGSAVITLRRTGDTTSGATALVSTSNGTATAGADYTAVSQTVIFPAGVTTATVTVPILDDALGEGNETVILAVVPGNGAFAGFRRTATLAILENDTFFNLDASSYRVKEGQVAAVTVKRLGPAAKAVGVDLSITGGTASPGIDYRPLASARGVACASGATPSTVPMTCRLTFAAGTRRIAVPITTVDDATVEGEKTVVLTLSNPGGGALLGVRSSAPLTIAENDRGGRLQFSQALYKAPERATVAVITLVRSGGMAGGVTVEFTTGDGPGPTGAVAGVDYAPTAKTVTFGPGQMTRRVRIPLGINDSVADGGKFVTLTLRNPGGGAALGARTGALLKIVDDDPLRPSQP